MAPQTQQERIEDELRAQVDEARLTYELARAAGATPEQDAALWAWKLALDAFVTVVMPREDRQLRRVQEALDIRPGEHLK